MTFLHLPRCAPRRLRLVALLLAGVLLLAACSGGSNPAEVTTSPTPTDNGKRYSYAAGSVPSSQWPAVCALLTEPSAETVIGTTVTVKAFHHRCYYIPQNDLFPTLTVTILGIGSDLNGRFDSVRASNSAYRPTAVPGLGERAVAYALTRSPTYQLDLLARAGLFEIALRSPAGQPLGIAAATTELASVGRVLAREFAG